MTLAVDQPFVNPYVRAPRLCFSSALSSSMRLTKIRMYHMLSDAVSPMYLNCSKLSGIASFRNPSNNSTLQELGRRSSAGIGPNVITVAISVALDAVETIRPA